ncbi:OmpA family protein [Hyphomonas sp.]|uniref:OmpA family protein n=1 Tax=Hyphomonas sp. TaxID=87 RepID=UPI0025B983C5|nr:OmpA family protein [Hyphomonas sp.]
MRPERLLAVGMAGAALLGMAACGSTKEEAPAEAAATGSVQCVPLAEGQYYWDGTAFVVASSRPVPAPAPEPEPDMDAADQPEPVATTWVSALERTFPDAGYPWMGLHVNGPVAVLTGLAPDPAAKEQGFAAGQAALEDNPEYASGITLVVDGISVEGGDRGAGEALAQLADGEPSLRRCQTAFDMTMQERSILFQSNLAIVSATSHRLLDALTGVALLCDSHAIEIGAHTDSRGSNEYNEVISQQRSDAVRDYMTERGVDASALTPVGYGESRPIDRAENYDAWAKNRRMEFKVSERQ